MRILAVISFASAFLAQSAVATSAAMPCPRSPRSPKSPASAEYQPLSIDLVVDAAASRVTRMLRELRDGTLTQSEFDEMIAESPVLKAGISQLSSSPLTPRSDVLRTTLDQQAGRALAYLDEEAAASLKRATKDERFKFFMQEMSSSRSSSRADSPASPLRSAIPPVTSTSAPVTTV